MTRILTRMCLSLLLFTAACSDEPPAPAPPRPDVATQTVLLYMPGRSLHTFYDKNIEGVCRAVSQQMPGDGRILICYQPEAYDRALLQEIRYDHGSRRAIVETLHEYTGFAADSPESVGTLLADLPRYAPAARYGLIIGCHGKAWVPASAGSLSVYSLSDGTEIAAGDEIGYPLPGAKPTRSFGDSRQELDIEELARTVGNLPYRFDYLIFDACFMANIETLYDLRHSFDYIIASPCEIMAAGFPYDRAIPHLFAGETPLPERLTLVCQSFWDFYQNDWNSVPYNEQSGCISLCITAALEGSDGAPGLDQILRQLHATPQREYDPGELQSYEGMSRHLFYDLGHYVRTTFTDEALLAEFEARMKAAFPPEACLNTEQFYSAYNNRLNPIVHYSGVSTSEPSERYREELTATAWWRATH